MLSLSNNKNINQTRSAGVQSGIYIKYKFCSGPPVLEEKQSEEQSDVLSSRVENNNLNKSSNSWVQNSCSWQNNMKGQKLSNMDINPSDLPKN